MTRLGKDRRAGADSIPHRALVRVASGAAPIAIRAVLALAAWCGLVAGLAELGTRLVQDGIDRKVTVDSIRTNRHWAWMVPVSDLAILGTCGLALAAVARRWPRATGALAPYPLAALAFLAPLLAVRGLHPGAALVLACGLAARAVPLAKARAAGFGRLVRLGLPGLAAAFGLLVVGVGGSNVLSERRALAALPPAAPGTPNVLLLVLDNVRADSMSLYGSARPTTPELERRAKAGVRFEHARATAPWTLPSHASLLTGRWPHELSANVDHPLDAARPTLAEYLGRHGYATAGFVANTYYCNAWYGLDRGFARYEDFPENVAITPLEVWRSSAIGRRLAAFAGIRDATPGGKQSRKSAATINRDALAWIDARPAGRPFFAFLNYYDAHAPFDPPEGHPRRFGLSARDRSEREATLRSFRDLAAGRGPAAADPARAAELTRAGADLLRDSYDDCLAYLDGQVGRLLDDLERRGLLANTLVIVTSDHGEHFGERGLFGHGHSLYRDLIDVPLLILPPSGGPAGLSVGAPASLRDVPATVVDLLGLAEGSPFPGRSLARHWGPDPDPAPGDPPLSEVEHQTKFPPSPHVPASRGPLWSVLADDRVYIRHHDGREELYDFAADRAEARDLAPTERSALEGLRGKLGRLLDR